MKSFLHLETARSSASSLLAADGDGDNNGTSFLLSSPTSSSSSVISVMTATATATAVTPAAPQPRAAAAAAAASPTTLSSSCSTPTSSPGSSPAPSTDPGTRHGARQHRCFLGNRSDSGDDDGDDDAPLGSRRNRGNLSRLDHSPWPGRRPSSSPNQPRPSWSRSKSPGHGTASSNSCLLASSDQPCSRCVDSPPSPVGMTRADFEALPPTIQRKYFSALERLRFARSLDDNLAAHDVVQRSPASPPRHDSPGRRPLGLGLGPDELDDAPHRRPRPGPKPLRVDARRLRAQSHEQLSSHARRQSVILDAADEACLKMGKRHAKPPGPRGQPDDGAAAKAHPAPADQPRGETAAAVHESFRWLDDDDELDLRLYLDDYHLNLREEVLVPAKRRSRRPSFRRHLSISRLPFGGRMSATLGRPAKDAAASPPLPDAPPGPGRGHVRRRSRALSLMSPGRQADASCAAAAMDPAASHYQDPEARMKLRVYLASPHKFDEAVEFGFPSIDELHGQQTAPPPPPAPRLRSFLDDASSLCSGASAADPESPRTPETLDKPGHDRAAKPANYAQASASSREMTLRMTLTRPDLRALDDDVCAWQRPPRRSHARDDHPPLPCVRDAAAAKDSLERHFAAIDEEADAADGGVVRRFWNRVRRT